MQSRGMVVLTTVVVAFLIVAAGSLTRHAWNLLHVRPVVEEIRQAGTPADLIGWIDLQIEDAKRKVGQLDPGPPPPWYAPRYYYEWLPKERLYGEAQEALSRLQKQRRALLERGTAALNGTRVVWNAGIAPLLHLLLAGTLVLAGLRIGVRVMLIRRKFGWVQVNFGKTTD